MYFFGGGSLISKYTNGILKARPQKFRCNLGLIAGNTSFRLLFRFSFLKRIGNVFNYICKYFFNLATTNYFSKILTKSINSHFVEELNLDLKLKTWKKNSVTLRYITFGKKYYMQYNIWQYEIKKDKIQENTFYLSSVC